MQIGLTPCTVGVEVTIPHKPKTEVFESQGLSGVTETLCDSNTSGAAPNGISCQNSYYVERVL